MANLPIFSGKDRNGGGRFEEKSKKVEKKLKFLKFFLKKCWHYDLRCDKIITLAIKPKPARTIKIE